MYVYRFRGCTSSERGCTRITCQFKLLLKIVYIEFVYSRKFVRIPRILFPFTRISICLFRAPHRIYLVHLTYPLTTGTARHTHVLIAVFEAVLRVLRPLPCLALPCLPFPYLSFHTLSIPSLPSLSIPPLFKAMDSINLFQVKLLRSLRAFGVGNLGLVY